MQAIFKNAKLLASVMVVGENKINIDDELNTRYEGNLKKLKRIKSLVGLQYRHEVDEKTTISDLAEYGAKILFEEYGLDKNTIDAIIVVTQTPDFFLPATACYLHGRLDLNQNALAFDINQSCAGYVYGLYIAFSMIENGGCKNILLVSGDTNSKLSDPKTSKNKPFIGGDGVSVSLITKDPNKNTSYFEIGTDGKGVKYLFTPYGAFKNPTQEEFSEANLNIAPKQSYMNGLEIFNFATQKEPLAFNSLLEYAKCSKDELDFVFFHQANKDIVDFIIKKLNLFNAPNDTISKYGNLDMASIPATICDHLNTYKNPLKKDLKVLLGGFGAGLSWANAIINLDKKFWCKQTQIYKKG